MKTNLLSSPSLSHQGKAERSFYVIRLASLLLASSVFISLHAQVELVKDINQDHNPEDMEYKEAVDVNGMLYFISNTELWRSNSKTSGTVLVKKFISIHSLRNVAGVLFFAADDGSGLEPWKSGGASYSTVRIKDIVPGTAGSHPEQLTACGSLLFFAATTSAYGRELWRTDGTSSGTFMVKDILNKGGSSNPSYLASSNSFLFFAANDGINGYELWRTDGTTAGTSLVKDIRPGSRLSSAPRSITDVNGTVFFTADDGINGRELWKSDGTSEGTILVIDIVIGSTGTFYNNLTNVNGTLFFSANDKIHGEELWKSNGTAEGTVMVKDLRPGPKGSGYSGHFTFPLTHFTAVNGMLYFTGYKNDGYYFWKSDGTEAGTIAFLPVKSFGIMNVIPRFTFYNGSVFFYNGGRYNEGQSDRLITANLMKVDINGSINQVASLLLNDYYSNPNPLLVYSRNLLYLTGRRSPAEGYALFKTSGTSASTQWVADAYILQDQSSEPASFLKIGGSIYFTIMNGKSLWKTDGTPEGTQMIIELGQIHNLINVDGQLYFIAYTHTSSGHRFDIYKTDGTSAGTYKLGFEPSDPSVGIQRLANVNGKLFFVRAHHELWVHDGDEFRHVTTGYHINMMLPVGNLLYFRGHDSVNGSELWKSDGTTSGTKLVKDINPSGHSNVNHFTAFNDILYFTANDGVHGQELWRSDGTASGTYMVKDVRTYDGHLLDDILHVVATGNNLFFSSEDANYNWVLWKSNGTPTGTIKVASIPRPTSLIASNNRLYFVTYDGTYALWKSDGTASTTRKLADLPSDGAFWRPEDDVTVNGILYASFYGKYLWRSDGTPCGTYFLETVNIYPTPIEHIGSEIIFGGTTEVGTELYKVNVNNLPVEPCPAIATLALNDNTSPGEPELVQITSYPNPFEVDFTLELSGPAESGYGITISDMSGTIHYEQTNMAYNRAYRLGPGLPAGFYLLRIRETDRLTVQKMIKSK
jgi:ELWxxDGT repeat protein